MLEEICSLLSVLYETVKLKGAVNFHDDKTASESFFLGLFNIVYGLNLKNVNLFQLNYPAIDLADKEVGKCYQITYENSKKKIDETKAKYKEHGINNEYPDLVIFIFGDKPGNRPQDEQVHYRSDLVRAIDGLELDKKNQVLTYLKMHLKLYSQEKKELELKTIQVVINFLSVQSFVTDEDEIFIERPYPEEKLRHRFGDYYEVIREEYADLYAGYSQVLLQAKADYIDDGNSGKVKSYLRRKSREALFDNSRDARAALDKVVQDIKQSLDIEVHESALRFYILNELMECDIFPLSKSEKQLMGGFDGAS